MAIAIRPATVGDVDLIVSIGLEAVELAHRPSCAAEHLQEYLAAHYNREAITQELTNPDNIYHIIYHNNQPAGFSKIVINAPHANIAAPNVTKLDRIYLLHQFFGMGLGDSLLAHIAAFARMHNQSGIWLFTWTGNERAIRFYKKSGFSIIGSHSFRVSGAHYNPNHHMYLQL